MTSGPPPLGDPRTFRWVEAGVSGLSRVREWDAVVTARCAMSGDVAVCVALPDGGLLAEEGDEETAACVAAALAGSLEPPFRAVGVRRQETTWAVGGIAIEVARLPGVEGTELTYVVDPAGERSLTVDGRSELAAGQALEWLAARREGAFVLQGARLAADLWEISLDPL